MALLLLGTLAVVLGRDTPTPPARRPVAAARQGQPPQPSPSQVASPSGSTPPRATSASRPTPRWTGRGRLQPVRLTSLVPSRPPRAGRVVRYAVDVERGLGVDPSSFAAAVVATLTDRRGWQGVDGIVFAPAAGGSGSIQVRITLASPSLTDRLCAPLDTGGAVSCWNRGRAVINAKRWLLGAKTYGGDLADYRVYVVSHEVGHGLGHGHRRCPARGVRAPVMVQQTLSLGGCRAWPWPAGA